MATTFEIHPSVGISRVGNSPEFFVGPEPGGAPPARYRDGRGRLLRQAARFRVFECVRTAGGMLRSAVEVTPDRGQVEWTVHPVNRKGASPESPPTPSLAPAVGRLRNAGHANRADLVVDPGPATLSGPRRTAVFDGGTFLGAKVPLGEARTEADGRLLVIGGFGASGFVSPPGVPAPISHFANNDKWYDDMSDGPVTATVTLTGQTRPVTAKPAWVLCAPPDFAPGVVNFVTLYDVAYQAAIERKWRKAPATPSFTRDIQPLLQRAVGYQWVLELGRRGHASGTGMGDFASMWPTLANPDSAHAGLRQAVFSVLRDPGQPAGDFDTGAMPRLHSSAYGAFPDQVLRPTPSQYAVLKKWAAGTFASDLAAPPATTELLPDALDRVALEACSGGPFYPGIEVGSIMADARTYGEAFRVDAAAHQPGQLTAGNAVPWQADFLACSLDAHSQLGWWPAQRPYQVRTKIDSDSTQFWHRGVTGYRGMVDQWHQLGVVVEATQDDGRTVFVETERRKITT